MIEKLFKEVIAAYNKQKVLEEEHYANGDYFNVFNVLKLSTNETRTHSAFIAELLNPKGSHGQGDYFLKKFIGYTGIENLKIDTQNVYVQVERPIGEIDDTYNTGGRIDIIVEDGDKGIIIENKIYATDQYRQLVRYYNYAESHYGNSNNYRLLYLSLNKEEASPASTESGSLKLMANKHYYSITYSNHIIRWLTDCVQGIVSHTIVNDIINQYIVLLKQLTNKMEENNFVIKALEKEEYFPVTLEIYKFQEEWKNMVWKSFFTVLKEELSKEGFKCEDKNLFDFIVRKHKNSNNFIHLTHESSGAYIGINTMLQNVEVKSISSIFNSPNATWPYGWKWLEKDYWKIRPYYNIEYMSAFFPKNRDELINYLISEIKKISEEAEKARIEI